MPQNFLACDRDQSLLLAPDLREWLPEDHLAWFVIDAVAELDLSKFLAAYRADGHGRAAHDPEMMIALLIYSYATGERSSRKIERRCREDIAHRVICANQAPDHATIARFRSRHQDALADLFSEVLCLCARSGLVAVGTIAFDGTRMAADAADRNNRTYRQLGAEILEEAEAADVAEDKKFGDKRGDELPPELASRKSRIERLREAKRQLDEERQARVDEMTTWEQAKADFIERTGKGQGWPTKPRPIPAEPTRRINTTDPDSRPVKTAQGFIQGHTAQAATTEAQVIVAAELITGGNERHRLAPMAEAAEAELVDAGITEQPGTVLADAGYWNSPQIEVLEAKGIRVLVPPDGDSRKAPTKVRSGARYERMRERLKEPDNEAAYRRRQQMIEPVFAQIKVGLRAGRFQRRGLEACRSEWRLIAATHNLLKLHRSGLALAGG
jgi:transposase